MSNPHGGFRKSAFASQYFPALGVFLLPLLIVLLRGGNGFAYPAADAPFSDLSLTHYPYTAFLHDQLIGHGSLPLWSPLIFSGAPLAANPLSGLWYPFGWPSLVLPLPFAFNLLAGLHLGWGALGMYGLLRRLGLKTTPAAFGGLAFALMPKLFAHWGAGHLTLLYAVPWTPWLLWAAYPGRQPSLLRRALPGVILGMIFLADVRWAAYAGALWLGWLIWLSLSAKREGEAGVGQAGDPAKTARLRTFAGQLGLTIGLAALLGACLWLPMLEFAGLTTRAVMTPAEALEFSLAPGALLGLIFPSLTGGAHETTLYAGGVLLLLAVLALVGLPRREVTFWGLSGGLALIYSLGSSLPGFEVLAKVPLFNLLRVPPRALFILGLALAVLAALALDRWQAFANLQLRRRARLAIVGVTSTGAGIGTLVLFWVQPERPGPFLWGTLALLAAGIWLGWGLGSQRRMFLFTSGLFMLLLADPGLAGQAMLAYRPQAEVFAEKANLALFLQEQPGQFRTYSPDFSLLQFTAYNHGLEQADGVDPLQLAAYVQFMEGATGIPNAGYSVTLPPLEDGFEANTRYKPDARLLGLLNVKFVLAGSPLPSSSDLEEIARIDGVIVYENLLFRPRAWVVSQGATPESSEFLPVELLRVSPNQIELTAAGPGSLVLAENPYPGWQVTVDGQLDALNSAAGVLRVVDMAPGEHRVRFDFRPRTVLIGALVSGAAWLGLLVVLVWEMISRRSRKSA